MGVALKAENIVVRYITGDFKDIGIKEYIVRRLTHNYHVNEFMAVDGVTFELEEGDLLGIIGSNGAGKSTLLKAIAGIMEPTQGQITANGEIAALLELGSGFDGDLTVKENAYLRGAMLGYTKSFMDATYDQIIDFAELREFENRPFKQLSSGMKSRLAFSIASLVKPDILILDEVLSVGDGAFQEKSANKMREIMAQGATTILVSHSLNQIRELCNKVLWLDHGKQIAFGGTESICDAYEEFLHTGVLPKYDEKKNLFIANKQSEDKKSVDLLGKGSIRIPQLDFIRTLAIISVVLCHSVESFFYIYQDRSIFWKMLSPPYQLFDLIGITAGRLGVPLFLFLTGALMLHKPMDGNKDCFQFYKKTYIPLFLTMWLWIILWNMFLVGYRLAGGETAQVTIRGILDNLFFVRNVDTILPAWYIPMILGVYIFLPFLMSIVKKLSISAMSLPLVLSVIVFFAMPTANLFLNAMGQQILPSLTLDLGFYGGIYGLYILLGYWISERILRRFPSLLLALLSFVMFALCVYSQFYLADIGTFYKLEYNFLPLLVCCACLFEWMLRAPMKSQAFSRLCRRISELSLAVFFLHNPIQYSIYLSGILAGMNKVLAVGVMFFLSFGLSILAAGVLSHVKWIRRWIGVRKK